MDDDWGDWDWNDWRFDCTDALPEYGCGTSDSVDLWVNLRVLDGDTLWDIVHAMEEKRRRDYFYYLNKKE
jgi:hypothetical protein